MANYSFHNFVAIWCKKLPEMARGLGRSVRILKAESKAAQAEPENEEKSEKDETKKEEA